MTTATAKKATKTMTSKAAAVGIAQQLKPTLEAHAGAAKAVLTEQVAETPKNEHELPTYPEGNEEFPEIPAKRGDRFLTTFNSNTKPAWPQRFVGARMGQVWWSEDDDTNFEARCLAFDSIDAAEDRLRAEIEADFKQGGVDHWSRSLYVWTYPADGRPSATIRFSSPSKRSQRRLVAVKNAIRRARHLRSMTPFNRDLRLLRAVVENVRGRIGNVVHATALINHFALKCTWSRGPYSAVCCYQLADEGFVRSHFTATSKRGAQWDFDTIGLLVGTIIVRELVWGIRCFAPSWNKREQDHRHDALARLIGLALYHPKKLTQAALDEIDAMPKVEVA